MTDSDDGPDAEIETVTATELLPIGRAQNPRLLVIHGRCQYAHLHVRWEPHDVPIIRSPPCAPHTDYLITIGEIIGPDPEPTACTDCGFDTTPSDKYGSTGPWELFMLADEVWEAATNGRPARFLCVDCVETRTGRRLRAADFTDAPVNDLTAERGERAYLRRTDRLLDRLTDGRGQASQNGSPG